MDGKAEWQVQIESNAKEVAEKVEQLKSALQEMQSKNHSIEITIDKKKFDNVIGSINNMLSNISKRTGDVKSFTSMLRQITKVQKAIAELEKSFGTMDRSSFNKFKKLLSPINDLSSSVKTLNGTVKSFQKTFESFGNRATNEINKVKKATDALEKSNRKSSDAIEKQNKRTAKSYADKIKKFDEDYKNRSAKPKPQNQRDRYQKELDEYSSAIEDFRSEYNKLEKSITNGTATKEQIANLDELQKKVLDLANSFKLLSSSDKGSTAVSRYKLINQVSEYVHNNSGMSKEFRREFQSIMKDIYSSGANVNVEDLVTRFNKLKVSIREAGQEGRKFTDVMKDKAWYGLAGAIGTYFGFEDIINILERTADIVIDINSEFTDLAKVSDATVKQLYNDFDSYAEAAKDVGGTISDTIAATAAWSKNGYNIPDSKDLAEVSMIYKNVGDNIDIDTANESLISTLKGFRLEAEEAMHVIDVFNEVSNNEAITSAGIGEALQRSAASFNAANTSLEKSVALVTATNTVLQNTAKTGNMWRTVSARLRGAETELVEMGEDTDGLIKSTSKLQGLIKGMTGFDIMESDGKTFKDIYEIVLGIGREWENLSDIDQAALLEALAGKQQSNALAAALSNIDILEKSYKEAMNAEGSAMREQEKYQESIQYSIDRTRASLQELANDFLSSDFLKGAIDFADKFINLLDEIVDRGGSIPALFSVISGGLSAFKNVGRDKMYSLILNMPTAC